MNLTTATKRILAHEKRLQHASKLIQSAHAINSRLRKQLWVFRLACLIETAAICYLLMRLG